MKKREGEEGGREREEDGPKVNLAVVTNPIFVCVQRKGFFIGRRELKQLLLGVRQERHKIYLLFFPFG